MSQDYSKDAFNALAAAVADHGFTVIPANGKRPAVRKWTNPKPTDRQWLGKMLHSKRYADHNLSIVCGRVVGIDIDEDDPAKAARLEALAYEYLGPTPCLRVGRTPRSLLLYRPADGEKIPSIKIAGCIDVLSGGKQFVAFGIHPETNRPYQWVGRYSPASMPLDAVPTITAAALREFEDAVSRSLGKVPQITHLPAALKSLKSRQSARQGDMLGAFEARIIRDANGRVADGREAFMAKLTATEYAKGSHDSPVDLGHRVWVRFVEEAELSRGKGSNPKRRWELRDALSKARAICRRKPDLKAPRRARGGHPASRLNAWRKPGLWTQAERERLMAEVSRRISTPAVLAVSRVMLDAVDMATGFCTLSIDAIAKRVSCSAKSVTKARATLLESGFWIGHRGVFVPRPLNIDQVVEKKGRKSVGGNIKVPSLYRMSPLEPISTPFLASPILSTTEPKTAPVAARPQGRPYQLGLFGAVVVDLEAERYRRGIIPVDMATAVRAEMRARGVTQDELAAELGISQPQLANALAGRFGLSPEPASRLLAWLLLTPQAAPENAPTAISEDPQIEASSPIVAHFSPRLRGLYLLDIFGAPAA
jgi:transcriptional regulator with XRE-family HTH domain